MKIKISYFYQIRFFKPYQIPVSTAVWDPKWFHNNKGQNYVFKDSRSVYNGIRMEKLHPDFEAKCSKTCKDDPTTCSFIEGYRQQLSELDFNEVYNWLEYVANRVKQVEGFSEEPEIILMVYETPDNPCSERVPLIEWFKEHSIEVQEFKKENNDA